MSLVKKIFENKEEIIKELSVVDGYRAYSNKDNHVLIKTKGSVVDEEVTLIIIDGGIWQYRYYNPKVSQNQKFISANEFMSKVLTDSGLQ